MDSTNILKNAATIIGSLTTIIYGSGYLALHARAHALGTDPAFTLVDDGYIFAGFRFLLITLIVLVLEAPGILFAKWFFAWLRTKLSPESFHIGEWILLVFMALVTIAFLKILYVNGVLLYQTGDGISYSPLQKAALGGNPIMSLGLIFLTVFVTGVSFFWLISVFSQNGLNKFTWILGMIVFIQLCILPIYNGVLYADHKVRVLAFVPKTLKDFQPPVAIVERSSSNATILGKSNNRYSLATLKIDDLNGIPVNEISTLNTFLTNDLAAHKDSVNQENKITMQNNESLKDTTASPKHNGEKGQTKKKKNFFSSITEYLNMTFEAIGSLSDGSGQVGQLWQVEINASGKVIGSKRIGTFDNLAWPVMRPDGSTIFSLQDGKAIKIDGKGQRIEILKNDYKWVKLLGVNKDNSLVGLISDGNETKPIVLFENGEAQFNKSPLSDSEKVQIAMLMQETRSYAGNRRLFVERSERGRRGFDVYLKWGDTVVNVSDCGDDSCRQPSLSRDFKFVLFIKQPRY